MGLIPSSPMPRLDVYKRQLAVSSRYLLFALLACLVGGGIGLLVGFLGIPAFLLVVIEGLYILPGVRLEYDLSLIHISTAAGAWEKQRRLFNSQKTRKPYSSRRRMPLKMNSWHRSPVSCSRRVPRARTVSYTHLEVEERTFSWAGNTM